MTLEDKLQTQLRVADKSPLAFTQQQLAAVVDYTCLSLDANPETIHNLATRAVALGVAAICIYPQHYDWVPKKLPLTRATVVNFPSGDESLSQIFHTIDISTANQTLHEIDYVFPYQAYLSGQTSQALSHCHAVYEYCKQRGLLVKVILETGAFPNIETIYNASLGIIDNGCDYLKTSTGKIAQGASLPAAFAMLSAIQQRNVACGIKLSGGIKTIEQTEAYLRLAQSMLDKLPEKTWFRFGASVLLDSFS